MCKGDGNIWANSGALQFLSLCSNLQPLLYLWWTRAWKDSPIERSGNQILENIPNARVKYVPAETFINEFLEHLRLEEMKDVQEYLLVLDLFTDR